MRSWPAWGWASSPTISATTPGCGHSGDGPVLHRDLFLVYHRAMRKAERVRLVARFVTACVERRLDG